MPLASFEKRNENVVHPGLYFLGALMYQEIKHVILLLCSQGVFTLQWPTDDCFIFYDVDVFFARRQFIKSPQKEH